MINEYKRINTYSSEKLSEIEKNLDDSYTLYVKNYKKLENYDLQHIPHTQPNQYNQYYPQPNYQQFPPNFQPSFPNFPTSPYTTVPPQNYQGYDRNMIQPHQQQH